MEYANVVQNSGTAATGSVSISGNTAILQSSKGKLESSKDGYSYAGQQITGNFTLTATVSGVTGTMTTSSSHQYRAGLMLGVNGSAPYAHSAFGVVAAGGYNFIHASRLVSGTVSKATGAAVDPAAGNLILRISRNDQSVVISYSNDGGQTFTTAQTRDFSSLPLPETVDAGIFAATGSTTDVGITFSNIVITKP